MRPNPLLILADIPSLDCNGCCRDMALYRNAMPMVAFAGPYRTLANRLVTRDPEQEVRHGHTQEGSILLVRQGCQTLHSLRVHRNMAVSVARIRHNGVE